MKTLLVAITLGATCMALAQGHNSNQPSPKLNDLDFLVGNWTGKQNFQMPGGQTMAADITLDVSKEVGGRYLQEKSHTVLPNGRTGDAVHMLAYDAKLGKYKVWWFNDTSVDPRMLTGAFMGDKLVMDSAGGKGPEMRATYSKLGDDHFTYQLEAKQGGAWRTLFISDYHKS